MLQPEPTGQDASSQLVWALVSHVAVGAETLHGRNAAAWRFENLDADGPDAVQQFRRDAVTQRVRLQVVAGHRLALRTVSGAAKVDALLGLAPLVISDQPKDAVVERIVTRCNYRIIDWWSECHTRKGLRRSPKASTNRLLI